MSQKTPLHDLHVEADAKMVDFGGWDMPLNYGSQIEEHHQVRQAAGMFDVSHMTVVDVTGKASRDYLRVLLANDIDRLAGPGRALYGCMLNDAAGVIDDLITYWLGDTRYRVVVNAATRDKDLAWMTRIANGFDVEVSERAELAMIAVQGPKARSTVLDLLSSDEREQVTGLSRFAAAQVGERFIARTGYTGEDGFEIVLPGDDAVSLWSQLTAAGVKPCGLGARDTLRLEAGMNLYGQDMDETTTPLESALAWTVAWEPADREFIGREKLEHQRAAGAPRLLKGLVLEDRGVLRHGQSVHCEGLDNGEVTSGSFSPTLSCSIGFARLPRGAGEACQVEIRGKLLNARVVKPPFVRNGKACEGILSQDS